MTEAEFCECLIVQLTIGKEAEEETETMKLSKEKIRQEVKKRRELFAVLENEGMVDVYQLFDTEKTGKVAFKQIAHALYEHTQMCSESVKESMSVLLMMEKNDERSLSYEQFGRLIMTVSKTADLSLEDLGDAMRIAVAAKKLQPRDANFGSELVCESEDSNDGNTSLTNGRLRKLFKLWDVDGDGNISLKELSNGLRIFQKASGTEVDAEAIAEALIGFDEDGDNELDPFEFITAMNHVTREFNVPISGFIDAMVLLTSNKKKDRPIEDTDEDLAEVFGGSFEFATEIAPVDDWDDEGEDPTEFSKAMFGYNAA